MKKIAVLLSIVMLFGSFCITAFAGNNIPAKAVFSETEDGDISVVVYAKSPEKLVSFFTVLEYDAALYSMKSAKASVTEQQDGTLTENFSGMWVFGKLADGTGCVGAFVSYNGVTKRGEISACEFIIHPETSRKNAADIKVFIKEYITEDNNEENDIYQKTPMNFTQAEVDVSDIFDYSTDEAVTITGIKNNNDVIFIPDFIKGLSVRFFKLSSPAQNDFLVFGRNVLSVEKKAFTDENMIIAPVGSAPSAAAKLSGGKSFFYRENVTADLKEPIFYTHEALVTTGTALFETDEDYSASPSNKIGGYWGTGTKITLKNGEAEAEFLLSVKGDINGDSVCDILDTMLCERYINGSEQLSRIAEKSTEFTGDDVVDVQDYTRIVNQSLEGENKVFDGVRGDFNGDYAVDILDVFAFNKMINGNLSDEEKIKADLNNDGIIDFADTKILEILVDTFN